jgi:hypothetical protein
MSSEYPNLALESGRKILVPEQPLVVKGFVGI